MIIAVDFDGILCEDQYPGIGKPYEAHIHLFKKMREDGDAKLILWTCRQGKDLEEAVSWCKKHGLEFDAINANLQENIDIYGTDSRKVFADLYIDDRSINEFLGCVEPDSPNFDFCIHVTINHLKRLVEILNWKDE